MIAQIAAVVIFVAMFVMIVLERLPNYIVTLTAALLTIFVVFILCMGDPSAAWKSLNLGVFATEGFWYQAELVGESSPGINWETIVFIVGMMVMVGGMSSCGFFRWLCLAMAKLVNYKIKLIFLSFMILSAVFSAIIGSITVILFLAAVTVELSRMMKFDPVPMILSEIFTANLGGAATMCGDPPNIIIGTSLGYSFGDFIVNTGLMAVVGLIFAVIYFYCCFRKQLVAGVETPAGGFPDPRGAITDKNGFIRSWIIFDATVLLLATHAQTGLTVSTIGVFIAAATLLLSGKYVGEIVQGIDWETVLFFIGLFIAVSGLEQTGILEVIADFIGKVSGGNAYVMVAIIIWIAAIASAFIDNIPFAATMVPVIKSLSATTGVDISAMAWALSMGTDVGGNATPIGASANVVGTSICAKAGRPIGWGKYCRYLAPATAVVIALSMLIVFVRYL